MGALGTLALAFSVLDRVWPKQQERVLGTVDLPPEDLTPGLRKEKARTVTVRNIGQRVKIIRELIKSGGLNPQVRALAHEYLNRKCGGTWCVPEKDQKAEVVALFDEVRKRVRYTPDPVRRDTFVAPNRTLFTHMGGDCDDSCAALGALLESVGFPTRIRVVQTTGYSEFNHVYLQVQLTATGQWMTLDPSQDHPAGWEVPAHAIIKKQDFPV
jgi:transglutaminase-like putative cysteine protease